MKKLISFFEIPASDFERAVKFYEAIFDIRLPIMECETEKNGLLHRRGDEAKCRGNLFCR